ncbi:MAG: hypothetical protein QXH60_02290 [Candidatus Pacearchaeota archaeon]
MASIIIDRVLNFFESFGSRDSVSHFSPEALVRGIEDRIRELEEVDNLEYAYFKGYKKREIRSLIRLGLRALKDKDYDFYETCLDKYYNYLRKG